MNSELNTIVYHKPSRRKGKLISFNKDVGKTAQVEFIVNFNKETGERTTKLEQVQTIDIVPVRNKKRKSQHKPLQIKVKYFDKEIPKIEKFKHGDWIDLRAAETIKLKQFEYKLIPLGVGMKLPKGFEANVAPRSSTFKNFGILQTNSFGIIDESYCGNDDQWHFPALAMRDTEIKKGDRICQFRINHKMQKTDFVKVDFLDEVSRGGIGSTGTK